MKFQMQPQNVLLQNFIRDLVTNGCDSFTYKLPYDASPAA